VEAVALRKTMTARALRSKRKEERQDSRGVLEAEGGGASL
jgi:hypothetical protein